MASPIKLGVLDDYAALSAPYLSHLPSAAIDTTTFTTPLPAYSAPTTTDAQRTALVEKLAPFEVLSTMRERTPFPAELIEQLPNLRIILATGGNFTSWDLDAIKARGIRVYAAPGKGRTDGRGRVKAKGKGKGKGGGHPTTQHVWALILGLARNVAADDAAVKRGGWQSGLAVGLTGKTLGVVGLGRLGMQVARIGVLAFGMRVVCWSSTLTQDRADEMAREAGLPVEDGEGEGEKTFRVVSKEELFREADVVSLHYVLSERSRGMVGAGELGMMKGSALFVNTSRGPLVDEGALLETLRQGKIAGAALDVFDVEPLPLDSAWRSEGWGTGGTSRVVLTPHMGYVEDEVLGTWYDETAENLERLVEGRALLHRIV